MADQATINKLNEQIPRMPGKQIVEYMIKYDIEPDQLPNLKAAPDKYAYAQAQFAQKKEEKAWAAIAAMPNDATTLAALKSFVAEWSSYSFAAAHVDEANSRIQAINDIIKIEKQAQEQAEWSALAGLPINDYGLESKFRAFISKWESYDWAAPECRLANDRIEQIYKAQEQAEWDNLWPYFPNADLSLVPRLQAFISKWEKYPFAQPHCDEAKNVMLKAGQNQEQLEWDALFMSNPTIQQFNRHMTKWHAQGIDTHVMEADEKAWDIVNASPDRITAIREYINVFGSNSIHANDAQKALMDYDFWIRVKGTNDIFQISEYVNFNQTSFFYNEAKLMLADLKAAEIARMQSELDQYPVDSLLNLLSKGVFTEQDLIGADVATEDSMEILRNLGELKENLPNLVDVQAKCDTVCAENRTDVYLFGTPATGKTCILMGLIGSSMMDTDYIESAGEYASALSMYLRSGFTPGQTVGGFVATVQSTITDSAGHSHKINLVELAGEDFAVNIANKRDGVIDFSEMGDGVPALLSNNNRKVFFLIVDPTSKTLKVKKSRPLLDGAGNPVLNEFGQPIMQEDRYIIDQRTSLQKMINLLQNERNSDVMRKVDAIHVIVTKGDKLGEEFEREDKAYDLFFKRYREIVRPLTELCKKYGINQHPQKDLNGVPRLFTFSLGQFFPGGYYQYDDTDANALVEAVSRSTEGVRAKTNWDRFCDFMNKPII